MADEGPEGLVEYKLETSNGHVLNDSKGYDGKGKATYPNGDTYDGEFQGGVSTHTLFIIYLPTYFYSISVENWRRWSLYICIKIKSR
jgi:hypothetical protein